MKHRKQLPSVDVLNSVFRYDAETGLLFRRSVRQGYECQPLGFSSTNGYLRVGVNKTQYAVHRIAWKMVFGTEPFNIDHINGDRSDNRIKNLREASWSDNNRNIELSPMNKSGYSGVSYVTREKRWRAVIKVNKKQIYAGYFKDKIDAVIAYNDIAMKLHGEFARRKVAANAEKLKEEFGVEYGNNHR